MSRQFQWLFVSVWMIAGAAQAADESTGTPLYSLVPGSRWTYEETQKTEQVVGEKTNVTHVTGTIVEEIQQAPPQYRETGDVVLSRSVIKQQTESEARTNSNSGGFVQLMEWRQGDLYLRGIRIWVDGLYSEDMNVYEPPLLYLKSAARVAESWTVGTQLNMGIKMPTMATMDGIESVTVPAGTFAKCLKVTYVVWKMSGVTSTSTGNMRVVDGDVRDTIWFAKDVGVVKEVQVKISSYLTGAGTATVREEQSKLLKSYIPVK
jgi:hypothetical protein